MKATIPDNSPPQITLRKKAVSTSISREAEGSYKVKRPIIVMGGAKCVWDDLKKAQEMLGDREHDLAAINDIGVHYPYRIHHWLSLERKISEWYESRVNNKLDMRLLVHVYYHDRLIDHKRHINYFWKMNRSPIMSGIFGPIALNALGYSKIVLAGIPSDNQARFFDPPDRTYHSYKASSESWRRHQKYFGDTLRSMSGYTKELFGEPTRRWLGVKK